MKKDTLLFSLHKYFIWADRMRRHYYDAIKIKTKSGPEIDDNLYMSYWYGAMYVVIEGYKESNISDPDIDELLKSSYVDLLRKFRNGVFHYQSQYFDESRYLPFIMEGQKSAQWIQELREAFSKFFINNM